MSIRLRLTLWYAAVMAVTLIGASMALYLVLALNALRPARDQLLSSKGNSLAGSLSLRATQFPNAPASRRGLLAQFINTLAEGDLSMVVRDADMNITERSANLGDDDLPLADSTLEAVRGGQSVFDYDNVDGVRLRLYTTPVFANGQLVGAVQVARPTRQVEETLDHLRNTLLVGNSLLVLLGALAGWFLAGRSLEPVRRITRTAEEIESSGQLDRRVFYRGPRDELGELAVAFNNMLSRLEATFNAQRRFVADASHELRTPLTTLRVNLGVLSKGPERKSAVSREILDDVTLELERMSRLVERLLELARADAGQQIERATLELDPLLERVERRASQLADGVNVALSGPRVGAVVGNSDGLMQLLLILLENAVKYTPSGGTVSLVRGRENGSVRVTVVDSGPGIAPEDLPRIFDRFYRAPTARGRPGTGLGLPIARWLAEQHHGKLTVDSVPGRGSRFTVWLPAAER
jgi:two-component system, OmpR family, sensor kinase